jgi:hypothetical protein
MGIIRKIRDRRRFIKIKKEVEKIRESILKK